MVVEEQSAQLVADRRLVGTPQLDERDAFVDRQLLSTATPAIDLCSNIAGQRRPGQALQLLTDVGSFVRFLMRART